VFDPSPRAAGPPQGVPTKAPSPTAKFSKPTSPATKSASSTPTAYCASCGVRLKKTDGFCWNCGAKTGGTSESVKLPRKETPPVTRNWRNGR
jgi:predicted amidophosphoribosyltransferase